MAATKRHGPDERKKWAARWHASGLSGPEFAKRHGLQVESVYRWGREFPDTGRAGRSRGEARGFTEVRVREGRMRPTAGVIEVVLANGRVVRVGGAVDARQLRAVIEALES